MYLYFKKCHNIISASQVMSSTFDIFLHHGRGDDMHDHANLALRAMLSRGETLIRFVSIHIGFFLIHPTATNSIIQ